MKRTFAAAIFALLAVTTPARAAFIDTLDPTSVVWSKSAAGSRGNARDTTERAKLWC
jgi:hypothetical protein